MFNSSSRTALFGYSTRLAELAVYLPATSASIQIQPPIEQQEWEPLFATIGCSPEMTSKMAEPIEMILGTGRSCFTSRQDWRNHRLRRNSPWPESWTEKSQS